METADKRPRVVVLEDDRGVADLVREILDDSGFHTLTADHNTPAEVVAEHRPRLLLMDLLLGDRHARDVLASLRGAGLAHVPLVLLSGKQELESEMRDLGAVAALAKPFDIDELVGTCRGVVGAL
ncbi:MAG TPA: response regulator [Candidatus Acidoferrales bacterium]|nr:response regulator [Candidatus Acidoferrales bacterium]